MQNARIKHVFIEKGFSFTILAAGVEAFVWNNI